MQIRCPHCHQPIEVLNDDPSGDVTCPSCGSWLFQSVKRGGLSSEVETAQDDGSNGRLASAGRDQTVKLWNLTPRPSLDFFDEGGREQQRTAEGRHPTLRAEREALRLIHFLRAQGQPQSDWLDAISSDQTIAEPVRRRALQFARESKP